jgi:hypothetical protein
MRKLILLSFIFLLIGGSIFFYRFQGSFENLSDFSSFISRHDLKNLIKREKI